MLAAVQKKIHNFIEYPFSVQRSDLLVFRRTVLQFFFCNAALVFPKNTVLRKIRAIRANDNSANYRNW